MCFDAGDQNARGEGFFDVIVGSQPEAAYFIHVFAPGRDQQYRYVQLLAQSAAESEAIDAWQHQVQQYKAVSAAETEAQPLVAVFGDLCVEIRRQQIVAFDSRYIQVVFNN